MKKRAMSLILCGVMLLSSLPLTPFLSDIGIVANAADVSQLRTLYNNIPDKSRWSELYIDTSSLELAYDNAKAILENPGEYSQANVDAARSTLETALALVRKHTVEINLDRRAESVDVGGSVTLNPILKPEDAADRVEWLSSNDGVATVSNGVVTIRSYSDEGVVITAISNGKSSQCSISVKNPLGSVDLSETSVNVFNGQNFALTATPKGYDRNAPISYNIDSVSWYTSNAAIATVSPSGSDQMTCAIQTHGEGRCTVKVVVKSGNRQVEKNCDIVVSRIVEITNIVPITVAQAGTLYVTERAKEDIRVRIEPSTASIKDLQWISSDPTVATVTQKDISGSEVGATIEGVQEGTAKITYTATDGSGRKGSFTVQVRPSVKSLILSPEKKVITPESREEKIMASVLPSNSNQVLKWESSNPNVCDVDYSGKLNPKMIGECTITASTTDGSGLSESCFVRVEDPAASVSIDKSTLAMNVGDAPAVLRATVTTTSKRKYNDVEWISSKPEIASVASDGSVTANYPGTAIIKAVALDGTGKDAVCTVTVTAPVKGVSLPETQSVDIGKTVTLKPTFEPEYASNQKVKWSCSDTSIATVSSSGVVTAKTEGSCVVTCTTEDGGFKGECTVYVVNPVGRVELSYSTLTIDANTTFYDLKATVYPETATDKRVTWSSSDPSVVSVNENGVLTASKGGTAVITATSVNGNRQATCRVTVIEKVSGITFPKAAETIYTSQSVALVPTITPETATNKTVTWISTNPNVATVNAQGVVTAVGQGTTIIIATTNDGGFNAQCTVTVVKKTDVTGVSFYPDTLKEITLDKGTTYGLDARIYPTNASNKELKWTTSNSSVASVSANGIVTGVGPGSAVITVTTVDGGYTAKCTVVVTQCVTGVKLNKTTLDIPTSSSKKLTATVSPSNASNKNVTWHSSNESVATVNSEGIVTGKAPGKATVTVTTTDGNYSAYCDITVYNAVSGIKINSTKITLAKGGKTVLSATVLPADATDRVVTWSSSDSNVVSVNSVGQIQGVSVGSAVITVKSSDGKFSDKCLVEVIQMAKSIELNYSAFQLDVGKTKTITATVKPNSTTNKTVKWSSSDKKIAKVSSKGVVTAVAPGKATIKAVSGDGAVNTTCKVTVTQKITALSFKKSSTTVMVGEKVKPEVVIVPTNTTEDTLKWKSSDKTIATVSSAGVVKGVATGTVKLTASNSDGTAKATCYIVVRQGAEKVVLDKSSLTVSIGKTAQLKATVKPVDTANKKVKWTSSNYDVADVSSSGKITAKATGYAEITATTVDGGFTATCKVLVVRSVKGIKLNMSTADMEVGTKLSTLKATISPKNATNSKVKWTSSNKKVAKVSSNGVVTAVSSGTAVITVTTEDGGFTAKCTVKVSKHVKSIKLNKTSAKIENGDNLKLKATITPSDATDKKVKWTTSNKKVATVDTTGVVTSVAPGKATITAKTSDGGFVAKCVVTVVVSEKSINLNKTSATLKSGKKLTLKTTFSPSNTTDKTIEWVSSKPSVATVSSKGVVTAVKGGKATITATSVNGKKAKCTVTVIQSVTKITLSKTSLVLHLSESAALTAKVTPVDAVDTAIKWSSNNTKVATVSKSGTVKAVSAGEAVITALNEDTGVKAVCTVEVRKAVTSVSLDKTSISMGLDSSEKITATVLPASATNKNIKWSSSDPKVATVDSNGVVKSVSGGTCVITAKTVDKGLVATCNVSVNIPLKGFAITTEEKTIYVGETEKLPVKFTPDTATNRKIDWSSSNAAVASVNADGEVKALSNGTTTITGVAADGGYKAACLVTVKTKASSVKLDRNESFVHVGKTTMLIATVLPSTCHNKNVTWTSSDENVATVDANGMITGKKLGSCIITVTSEDGGFTDKCTLLVSEPVTSISINADSEKLVVGGTRTVIATVKPTAATNQKVLWTSSNEKIATVKDGVVTAVSRGNVVITAETEDGGFKARCIFEIIQPVEKIVFDEAEYIVALGDKLTLSPQVLPENANDKSLSWSSSAENVAPISSEGVVSTLKIGEVKVTATAASGSVSKTVTVKIINPAASVKLDRTAIILWNGDSSVMTATVSPESATYKDVTWTSSDEKVAKVDENGKITAIGAGDAVITATSICKKAKAEVKVTVKQKVEKITLNKTAVSLDEGQNFALVAEVTPDNATDKKLTYKSSDTKVATVDATGIVSAVGKGEAKITVSSSTEGVDAVCTVKVIKTVKKIELSKTALTLEKGKTATLTATVTPSDATDTSVVWSSSDEKIATVSNKGVVTAKTSGSVIITAKSANGEASAACVVNIVVYTSAIKLSAASAEVEKGKSITLTATVTPTDATEKTVIWTSSDEKIATVKDGVVTAVSSGKVIITCSTKDKGISAKCEVTVTSAATGVKLNKNEVSAKLSDKTVTLTATVTPTDASNKNLIWTSSDEKVATVKNGVVTLVAKGTATVYVKTADGGFMDVCKITVL